MTFIRVDNSEIKIIIETRFNNERGLKHTLVGIVSKTMNIKRLMLEMDQV